MSAQYLEFYDYLFKKNQDSALPSKRAEFYNIAQEIIHEINIIVDREGVVAAFERMRIPERNEKN